jgi:hypothetical protein
MKPVKTLEKAVALAAKAGTIFIATANVNCIAPWSIMPHGLFY